MLQFGLGYALIDQFAVGRLPLRVVFSQFQPAVVRRDQGVVRAEGIAAVAGPRIVCGVPDHAGAYRVEFDVAIAGQAVACSIHQRRFVSAFPECAGSSICLVDRADVIPAHVANQQRNAIGIFRRQE